MNPILPFLPTHPLILLFHETEGQPKKCSWTNPHLPNSHTPTKKSSLSLHQKPRNTPDLCRTRGPKKRPSSGKSCLERGLINGRWFLVDGSAGWLICWNTLSRNLFQERVTSKKIIENWLPIMLPCIATCNSWRICLENRGTAASKLEQVLYIVFQGLLHLFSAWVWEFSSFNSNAVDLCVSISSPICKQQLCHQSPLIVRLMHCSFWNFATHWSRFQGFPSAFCCKAYLTHLVNSKKRSKTFLLHDAQMSSQDVATSRPNPWLACCHDTGAILWRPRAASTRISEWQHVSNMTRDPSTDLQDIGCGQLGIQLHHVHHVLLLSRPTWQSGHVWYGFCEK